ncbi:MAG: preprotein translocase subunit SecA [bacterium]|nr:preprotein translocase subunit SecA [bacterium]
MSILHKIFGDPNKRAVKKTSPIVEKVNSLEKELEKLSDTQLKAKTDELKSKLKKGHSLDRILPEAFALIREASKRTLKLRHFDVQLVGGVVLHQGKIAEMRTGEGKTLAATLPVYLNGLSEKGVHVVTVNDYLARRDAGWMGQIYHFLGLSAGVIIHDQALIFDPSYTDDSHTDARLRHLRPVSRAEAYNADITYGTNNEFGFDYLRDNMVQDESQMVQRKFNFAIVDEVDSILIDEARTPLIISQGGAKSTEKYYTFAKIARSLTPQKDYTLDEKQKAVSLTEEGIAKIEKILGVDNVYEAGRLEDVHHIEQSLKAEALFKRDRDYVVSDEGEIIIVDEFTGRLMQGRRYSEGLHQAIEAKENVEIKQESQTLATISFQNYFRLYPKLAGMTGTALTEAEEFGKIYGLDVVSIPTHMPMIRTDMRDRIYKTELAKFEAVTSDVAERHKKGQPVLLGTVSIEKNEFLSSLFTKAKVPHEVLNAKNNEHEAEIIARAGQKGAVTLATNIAGRGTDIVLGEGVVDLGGLHVLGTERHEARRIDNQLRGRSGRQGDPGSSQFFVSLEDDLMRIFGSERIATLMNTLGLPDDTPIENKMITKALESAQKKVEGHNFDIRKHLVEYDDVMNQHREVIYKKRREFLTQKDLKPQILESVKSQITSIVNSNTDAKTGQVDLEKVFNHVLNIMPIDINWPKEIKSKLPQDLINNLYELSEKLYELREKQFGSDATRIMERLVCLKVIDSLWLEHLEAMDHLREGIGLRGYGQRDPLVEYKSEAYKMFRQLLNRIDTDISGTIFKVTITIDRPIETEITEGAKQAVSPTDESEDIQESSGNRSQRRSKSKRKLKQTKKRRKKR